MRTSQPTPCPGQYQSGAVLVISLILLLVLTVIGVTSMRSATLEEKMAANTMNHDATFHAAESAIENALDDTNSLVQAILTSNTVTVNLDVGDSSVTTDAQVKYLGSGIALGFSLGQNSSAFSSYRFDATGTATRANTGASVTVSQGVRRIGPNV
jgi:type IV pilus assembly protein PilX